MFVAGIDAHTRYVVVTVVNRVGELVVPPKRVQVEHTQQLLALLAPYRPLEAVMETSSSWPWLHDVLSGAGIHFVLAHARRLRAIAEANYKRDAIDAVLLGRMRVAGLIPEVYPTPGAQREWATLIRHRTALVMQRTAVVNRLHAQLHLCGLSLERGRLLTRAGRQWLTTAAWPRLSFEQRALARSHLRILKGLRPLVRALDRHIAQVATPIPEAQLLRTIPGIGAHRALLICAEALPIQRFRTPGHLASYAGLVPTSTQSGERPIHHGPIPGGANRSLRGALVRAVVSHVQHAPDSWLTQYYTVQKARVGWPVARVAAARKLARALHAMLRTKTPWRNERHSLIRPGESSPERMPQCVH
ncbi:MAG TPA: IS110 family transposase [Gemmatimonadaceae bacterium]